MELEEAIERLTLKATTSSADAPDYPNCIVMKKDLITILNHLTKQEKMVESVKDRIEYYLMGNSTLDDFYVREKELEKLLKILKKAKESKQMINNIKDIEQICKQIDELSFEELQNAMEKADAELQKEEGE